MKIKIRLPLLAQKSVSEARSSRTQLAESFELQLRSRLSEAGATITCRKGCNHCCYHPVFLTLLEGVTLYQHLQSNSLWSQKLKDSFERHSELTRGLATEVWALSLLPCPLLDPDDSLCRAYEERPFACRITYSIGNPSDCHPHTLGPGMIAKRDLFEAITPTETALLRQHHLNHFRLPLSTAVLYGEKIATGQLELEDCSRAFSEMP